MPPHPSTNFEIHKYYQNESKFNWVYSRNNLTVVYSNCGREYEKNI